MEMPYGTAKAEREAQRGRGFCCKRSINLLRLRKLERLDLGSNVFNRSIIQSLRFLKSLKTLSLSDNGLEGSFPAKELSVFEDLEMLDLSYNKLNGSLMVQGREIEKIIF
ncbi:receptor-like protein 15 [Quercus suber]|uniref:Receptor-like protein 15 n=1 Tax=Quercus suber TaxID=58331 RepID=A0AAW0JI35_QUESU